MTIGELRMTSPADRTALVRRALVLERLGIAWMLVEGGLSIATGLIAHSVALIGFGADSGLELVSALALYRRLTFELRAGESEATHRSERTALRVVGVTLLLLGLYIGIDSMRTLWTRSAPARSPLGLAVALAALAAMPLLGRAKLRTGQALGSRALIGDAKETLACAWLSAAAVAGVGANAAFGWWWADPVAALSMLPFLVREGREALEEAREERGSNHRHDDD
jgi:divalent metal cation (Fe/Co/Zn/Cd) transporter